MRSLTLFTWLIAACTVFYACRGTGLIPTDTAPTTNALTATTEGPPPGANQGIGFSSWDLDGNEHLTQSELDSGLLAEGLFITWDVDSNDYISPNEYHRGVYARWDRDRNGMINNDEWTNRNSVWDVQGDAPLSMNNWTNNSNADMTYEQFNANFGRNSNFQLWDSNLNNRLEPHELNRGLYKTLDENNDGKVDRGEFINYYYYPSENAGSSPVNPGPYVPINAAPPVVPIISPASPLPPTQNDVIVNPGSPQNLPPVTPGDAPSGATPSSVPSGTPNSAPSSTPNTTPRSNP